jgi:hypothetical protein
MDMQIERNLYNRQGQSVGNAAITAMDLASRSNACLKRPQDIDWVKLENNYNVVII